MLKIGVDIRILCSPLTGIGRYVYELCKILSQDQEISLYLYAPSVIKDKYIEGLKNAHLRFSNFPTKIGRQFWGETILCRQAIQDDVDLFWGPSHRLPYFLSNSIKKVVTIHDLVWKLYPETMRKSTLLLESFFMPKAVKKADHILADSLATKQAIKDVFNVGDDKLSVIYPGVHPLGDGIPVKHFSDLTNYILFVGTLEPRKNLKRLLCAYAQLEEKLKYVYPLVIAGGAGWGDVNLMKIIEDVKIAQYCKVLGYVNDEKLQSLYAHCAFLAFPSLYEGFGIPIIEATRYGKQVLTSNTSSMPEAANEYGVLVDPLSVDSILSGLSYLIHNPKEMPPQEKFLWYKSANELKEIFKKVSANAI
jgi:glycosyltransferase involved in cell wall biosynthesis